MLDRTTDFLVKVSSVMFLIVIAVLVANVIGRRIFHQPVFGTMDIVQYGTLLFMALAMGRTGFEDRHLSIRMQNEYLPKKLSSLITAACFVISAALYLVLMVNFLIGLPGNIADGKMTEVLKIPYYLVYIVLIVCMFEIWVTFLFQAVEFVLKAFGKESTDGVAEENAEERGEHQ